MQEKERIWREKAEREKITRIKERFEKWCNGAVDILRDSLSETESVNDFLIGKPPDIIFSEDYAQMLHAEPLINYWLDILCMGDISERQELFLKRKCIPQNGNTLKEGGGNCRKSLHRQKTNHGMQ